MSILTRDRLAELTSGETEKYEPPKFVIRPAKDDTGYNLVKKNYKRFIWTWNDYDKNNPPNLDEHVFYGSVNPGEISGMGNPDGSYPTSVTGYKHRNDNPVQTMPTDLYEDPDKLNREKKKKLKNLIHYSKYKKPIQND